MLFASAQPASADFDPRTGTVRSDEAAYAYDFESTPVGRRPIGWDVDGGLIGADQLARRRDDIAIEGDRSTLLGGAVEAMYLDASAWPAALIGRRVEVRLWTRDEGSAVDVRLWWVSGDPWPSLEGTGSGGTYVAEVGFFPSGRATDDGWYELTSGPVDYALGGRLAPDMLSLFDSQGDERDPGRSISGRNDPALRARVDGLEVIDLGPAAVPDASCRLPTAEETCGAHGICFYGRCVDGAAVIGPLMPPALRQAVVERRAFELSTFNGSRTLAGRWPALAARLALLPEMNEAHRFWRGLREVYMDTGDGHASGPLPVGPWAASDLCASPGIADGLPGAPELPIVYRVGANGVVPLARGDVIQRIDGLAPAAWMAASRHLIEVAGDPASFEVQASRDLLDLALLSGAEIEVVRCADADCAPAAIETLTFDLAESHRALWDDRGGGRRATGLCDHRVDESGLVDSWTVRIDEVEGVRLLTINGVPGGVPAWRGRVSTALEDGPELLIIDQRLGVGGNIDAVDHLVGQLLGVDDVVGHVSMPADDLWDDTQAEDHFQACLDATEGIADVFECGLAQGRVLTGDGRAVPRRVAVLGASVVSGNEYLLRLLQVRAGVRVFAPAPTTGGFGWIQSMAPLVREQSGGSMQLVDTSFSAGEPGFATGRGVAPDERVLFKQTDLLAGRDTYIEAAVAWLLAEEVQ